MIVLLMYCSQTITLSDVSPCGRAVGYATTRQNCGPDTCCSGGPPPGEPNGEPTSPIRRAGLNGPRSGTSAASCVRCDAGLSEPAAPVVHPIEQFRRGDHLETCADRAQRHGGPVQ